jgi:hypothetical protein
MSFNRPQRQVQQIQEKERRIMDIEVNDSDWNALSAEAQSQITKIVQDNSLFKGGNIVPTSSGIGLAGDPPPKEGDSSTGDSDSVLAMSTGNTDQCIDDCNSMEDVVVNSCFLLAELGPLAVLACRALARKAANDCRRDCRDAASSA